MVTIVRVIPCLFQRLAELISRSPTHTGREYVFRARLKAMSSIRGIEGIPPICWYSDRRTNIPWSPVTMDVSDERRFIINATQTSIGCRSDKAISNRPHCALWFSRASSISWSAFSGTPASACRNQKTEPFAAAAPARICKARPRVALITLSVCDCAIAIV